MRKLSLLALTLVAIMMLTSCGKSKKVAPAEVTKVQVEPTSPMAKEHFKDLVAQYAPFELNTDMDQLTEKQKQMLPFLIDAAQCMERIFWKQAYGDQAELLNSITDENAKTYAMINYGPWDRLNGNKPFLDNYGQKPLTANFYPEDITKEEFDALDDPQKNSWYTIIRRDDKGKLVVIPYHVAFKEEVEEAAKDLRQAAALAEDEGLKNFLTLRAEALLTDDYYASDIAWMDMHTNVIDFVVGPIETYEDAMFGYKASNSGQLLIKDKKWSKRLSVYGQLFPRLQAAIPVPDAYKAEEAKASADLNAYDVIYCGGDCNAGSKNIAINLPNDPKVHEARGTRKLQLKNAMRAKFEQIVVPISKVVMVEDQIQYINFNAFFENTMFHEVAHGLGVNYTIKDHEMVRQVLGNAYTSIEEGKADILGLYIITCLHEWNIIQDEDLMANYVTFMAGTFRSVRFGAASAHGKANMIRYNFFKEKGAFTVEADGKYRVNFDKMKSATKELVNVLITTEGDGDYARATEMIKTQGFIPEELQESLNKINSSNIPVDIRYNQGLEVLGLNH